MSNVGKVNNTSNNKDYSIFDVTLIDKTGNKLKFHDLPHKLKMLYFAANYDFMGSFFTPQLISMYKEMNSHEQGLEIIFVSKDKDEATFKNHWSRMPWIAVDFNDPGREKLFEKYEIKLLPTMILVNNDGTWKVANDLSVSRQLINNNGDIKKSFTAGSSSAPEINQLSWKEHKALSAGDKQQELKNEPENKELTGQSRNPIEERKDDSISTQDLTSRSLFDFDTFKFRDWIDSSFKDMKTIFDEMDDRFNRFGLDRFESLLPESERRREIKAQPTEVQTTQSQNLTQEGNREENRTLSRRLGLIDSFDNSFREMNRRFGEMESEFREMRRRMDRLFDEPF